MYDRLYILITFLCHEVRVNLLIDQTCAVLMYIEPIDLYSV